MTLHVHRAERSDVLADALAEVVSDPLPDPFAVDVVAVPARGVERWLRQRLSHRLGVAPGGGAGDGVCLNLEMPSPATLFADVVADALGMEPDADPWRVDALQWRVLEVLDDCAGQDWARLPATHLGYLDRPGDDVTARELRRGRRLAVAARLARLVDSYATQRPQMLAGWLAGHDTDGFGAELAEEHAWHPRLYRELVDRLATAGPAAHLEIGIAAIRDAPHTLTLPARLSLFGPTRLSAADLGVLGALAESRDVHLWLPHPSPVSWQRLSGPAADLTEAPARDQAGIAGRLRNPLLRSLGRDANELQLRLALALPTARQVHHRAPGPPRPPGSQGAPAPALQVLQAAVRDDAPYPHARLPLAPDDTSLQVHACHGRARQVEVLRDAIVGLLADDATLQPRDILIMCPDIEAFAPLLLGAFGASDLPESHPGQGLRLRLADRSLKQTNPVLAVLARLLELADSRVGAAEVLDLAALPPVRRRFRFTDDALDELRRWVAQSHIRWGLTVTDREPFGLAGLAEGTWHLGLDSWLLGIAMDPGDHQARLPGWPLDGIESAQVELVGRFTEFIHRLARCLRALTGIHPLPDWMSTLRAGLDDLTLVDAGEQWQRAQADRVLATGEHTAGPTAVALRRPDLVTLLADELRGRPTRSTFRSGDLTACSMVPMRSVPHRVICLLGVDDGDLPRAAGVDGDDLLAVRPRVGERDLAAEDRQLLLDAVLAATDHLVICYSGADERTGGRRPPAVPLGELLDDLDARLTSVDGTARAQLVRRHPLQPFDIRNFGGSDPNRSFDRVALRGAIALRDRADDPAAAGLDPPGRLILRRPLPDQPAQVIEFDQVRAFYRHPVRHFLRHRLGLSLADFDDEVDPELPIRLDGLQAWGVGDRMLRARLNGLPATLARQAELRRGVLPPRALGVAELDQIERTVDKVLRAVQDDVAEPAGPADVRIDLSDGRTLRGTLQQLRGDRLVAVQYSAVKATHRLDLWLQLLAAAASGLPVVGAVVRGRNGAGARQLAPAPEVAERLLADLVAGYLSGLREPLPLPPATADRYAQARRSGRDDAARTAASYWSGGDYPENRDADYQRTIGGSWAQLLAVRQLSELTWPITAHGESHWFGRISRAVFDPLSAYEQRLG